MDSRNLSYYLVHNMQHMLNNNVEPLLYPDDRIARFMRTQVIGMGTFTAACTILGKLDDPETISFPRDPKDLCYFGGLNVWQNFKT